MKIIFSQILLFFKYLTKILLVVIALEQ